jgi:hypothetical protein
MNKISFVKGYLTKEAGAFQSLLRKSVVNPAMLIGVPSSAAYGAGRFSGALTNPSDADVESMQAEYVKLKMEQAIEELERKRKLERIKREYVPNTASIRI